MLSPHYVSWRVGAKHIWDDIERLVSSTWSVDQDSCFRRPSINMGSYPDTVNLLEHLRSKSQIDCDSLDIQRELFNGLTQYPLGALELTFWRTQQ